MRAKLTSDLKVEMIEIGHMMNQAGLPRHFIASAVEAAFEFDGVYSLMRMWTEAADKKARDEIIADIQVLIDDYAQKEKVERVFIRFDDLDTIVKNVRKFKDNLRLIVDRQGGVKRLAELTEIPQPSLSRFFGSSTMPRRATLLKISRALDLNGIEIIHHPDHQGRPQERIRTKKKSAKGAAKFKIIHPWRICPAGEHWVRTHSLRIPPSEKNSEGIMTTRHGHCARNPTGKDQLYPDEIQEIGERNFPTIKVKPCPIGFEFGKKGTQYDDLIAGWTKYWNDVLKPDVPLDPNTVKALIATESSFNPKILANKKDQNSARGLMQITNATRRILGNEKGELKDHFLTLTREDLNDPSNNICAGIRWLFRKRAIASDLLKRNVSWEEAVAEFKGTRTTTKERATELISEFKQRLEALKKCGKK